MKVIINQKGVKREIEVPFQMCVDAPTLRTIVRRLQEADESNENGWSYGWITIYEKPSVEVTPNTEPLPVVTP